MSIHVPTALSNWVAENFPTFPHAHWGISGAAMLFEILGRTHRHHLILPGFICPELSAMAKSAGKDVIHIDVDRTTLLMNPKQLEECLARHDPSDVALLIDHPFGYPCSAIATLRAKYPGLLLVEDCVRALGSRIHGRPVGQCGDLILLSLYKNFPGNDHGAVLLSRVPHALQPGASPPISLRQRVSTFGPARVLYERLKRRRPGYSESRHDRESISWHPAFGPPNPFVLKRFQHETTHLQATLTQQQKTARELQKALADVPAIRIISPESDCQSPCFFLSFTVHENGQRNRLMTALHRKGLFLWRTWDVIPASFRPFHQTYPYGASESIYLSEHICHIPVIRFLTPARQSRLVQSIKAFFN